MYAFNVDIAIVIAVVAALTECFKQTFLKKHNDYASYVALALGLIYVFAQKYFYDLPEGVNFIDSLVMGMAIGFAASGGYENVKNLLIKGKQSQKEAKIVESEEAGMP